MVQSVRAIQEGDVGQLDGDSELLLLIFNKSQANVYLFMSGLLDSLLVLSLVRS